MYIFSIGKQIFLRYPRFVRRRSINYPIIENLYGRSGSRARPLINALIIRTYVRIQRGIVDVTHTVLIFLCRISQYTIRILWNSNLNDSWNFDTPRAFNISDAICGIDNDIHMQCVQPADTTWMQLLHAKDAAGHAGLLRIYVSEARQANFVYRSFDLR